MSILDKIHEKNAQIYSVGAVIGKEQIEKAGDILRKYKQGKSNLEKRIINDEQYYRLCYRGREDSRKKEHPTTAWLLNSVVNKHADLMDSYPEAVCLPRERQDGNDAAALSEIVPVVLECNDYERTYSDACWYYIKHGVCCQGVFWDSRKDNGLGDIAIKNIDILNLFWEPGVSDIQESRNLFYVSLIDNEVLKELYPDIENAGGNTIDTAEYVYEDYIDNSGKSLIVDWYYKKSMPDGRTLLHYVKFTGNTVLFASENEEGYDNGFYEHGEYPFTVARMYPEAGTPAGFGIVAVCRDPQMYIDTLDSLMLDYAYKTANPRFWCKKQVGVNKDEFLDWSKPIVEVEGDIDEERLKQITLSPMGTAVQNLRQMKVDELKETSSNRDFAQGGTTGGITSGAAIATLQEAGNKTSRDMIKAMYRSYVDVVRLSIELIRQFYDEKREFRITGRNGSAEFLTYSNENIREQAMGADGVQMFRKPIFDIDVKAQKSNPYSRLSQNETAVNLFNMGVFNPQLSQQALGMLEMMDFDGKEAVREYVMQGQTLQNAVNQQQEQILQMSQIIAQLTGRDLSAQPPQQPAEPHGAVRRQNVPFETAQKNGADRHLNSYGEKLVERGKV